MASTAAANRAIILLLFIYCHFLSNKSSLFTKANRLYDIYMVRAHGSCTESSLVCPQPRGQYMILSEAIRINHFPAHRKKPENIR